MASPVPLLHCGGFSFVCALVVAVENLLQIGSDEIKVDLRVSFGPLFPGRLPLCTAMSGPHRRCRLELRRENEQFQSLWKR